MAAYPPYKPQFGIYNNNNFSRQPSGNDGLTIDTAKLYFLQFPNAQTSQTEYLHSIGVGSDATFEGPVTFNETVTYNQDIEFLANVLVDGTATVMDNLLCDSTATISDVLTCENGIDISTVGTGLTFPDNTTQTTAFIEANYAQLNTDNTFLAGFTQTFSGAVNLNGATNGVTQTSGNNSTLLATTEFVQNAVQVSGVQVTDSPLLWSGANTWQYNSGTPSTLPYSYPYGISHLWNVTGGAGDCDLVCNSGVGSVNSAFNIYCVQGDTTGTQLLSVVPQLSLSNNNTPAFIRDGINVNNKNISNINTLSSPTAGVAINVASPLSTNTGNGVYINEEALYLYSGTEFSSLQQSSTLNQLTIYNNAPHTDFSANIAFNLNNNTGGSSPVNVLQLYPNEVSVKTNLNINNQNIINIGALNMGSATIGANTLINQSGAVFNIQNTYPSTSSPQVNITVKNAGGIDRGILISSTLISPTLSIDMDSLNITRMGPGSTGFTQSASSNDTSIATTAYVTTAVAAVSALLPVYTTTTATMTTGGDMTPVTLFTTAYTSGGYATFVSGAFSITLNNYFLFLKLTWASPPWNGYPPSAGGTVYINAYCTTNKTNYSCPILWSTSPPEAQIYLPTGAPQGNGVNYGFNFQSLGGIRQ